MHIEIFRFFFFFSFFPQPRAQPHNDTSTNVGIWSSIGGLFLEFHNLFYLMDAFFSSLKAITTRRGQDRGLTFDFLLEVATFLIRIYILMLDI